VPSIDDRAGVDRDDLAVPQLPLARMPCTICSFTLVQITPGNGGSTGTP